ncbi:hypothetical protein SDC9_159396 [bioreactor metagenome]|uniref:Uncharacterized protein n=1 Tax=bioreactor metagenome TaxID=1076179 RepID=A0A645FEQ9_9ZZZZ
MTGDSVLAPALHRQRDRNQVLVFGGKRPVREHRAVRRAESLERVGGFLAERGEAVHIVVQLFCSVHRSSSISPYVFPCLARDIPPALFCFAESCRASAAYIYNGRTGRSGMKRRRCEYRWIRVVI